MSSNGTSGKSTREVVLFYVIQTTVMGFRLSARSATSPESSLFHVGFRCVQKI